jgi:hypothetical protein
MLQLQITEFENKYLSIEAALQEEKLSKSMLQDSFNKQAASLEIQHVDNVNQEREIAEDSNAVDIIHDSPNTIPASSADRREQSPLLEEESRVTKSDIDNALVRVSELTQLLEENEKQTTELHHKHQLGQEENLELNTCLQQERERISQLENVAATQKHEIEHLTSELLKVAIERTELLEQLEETKFLVKRQRDDENTSQQTEDLMQKFNEKSDMCSTLSEQLKNVIDEKNKMEEMYGVKTNEIAILCENEIQLKDQLQSYVNEIESLKQLVNQHIDYSNAAHEQFGNMQLAIDSANNEIQLLHSRIQVIQLYTLKVIHINI